ncbi:hypothetical protein OV203_25040 [Nannocystis sp. ILAH1]|uniref:hypothetical protein n=1 Tax=Nannocystis sp. ILAH1 TaxID=2996789 RepID=UPI002270F3D2|nr:hypothetical protein [Nannocystis sp. ILAH1]MCY0990431.1 hypothetical protein [Nannocystis sp. ILAH1]
MKYLACLTLLLALPGCTDKGSDPGTESETADTSSTTAPDSTSTSDDSTTTSTTSATEPTSTSEPDDTTGTTSSSTTAPIDEACAFVIGKVFVSKKQYPCGPQPDDVPVETCPDRVRFTSADEFMYQSGDYGISGAYTCEAGTIVAEGESFQGTVDAAAGELVWNDEIFEVE